MVEPPPPPDDRPEVDAPVDAQDDAPVEAGRETPQSVLEVIARTAGVSPRVLLRDAPGEEPPVVRIASRQGDDAARDDERYQVLGEIGRGGVGIIFKSRDRDLGRDVAMKVLRAEMAEKPHVVERFIEEAQVAGQLQHPGVVPVYGMGLQADGRPFFTMKLVKGKTLAALLSARRSPEEDRRHMLGVFEQICQTMAYAHARGVVHRDLKPANIMLGAFGEVQIMDWGFAKILGRRAEESSEHSEDSIFDALDTVRSGAEGSQSIAGAVMGTPAYMPPEQAMGRIDALDERADVFALGSILCEIITGKPAYIGESTEQLVLAARGNLEDATARLEAASVSSEIRAIATACLSPAPSARPRDAGVVAGRIADHLAAVQERAHEAELAAAHAKADAEVKHQKLMEARAHAEREQARDAQRQREAAWAVRARKRALLLAALIIGAVLVGAGAWHGVEQDREDRARDATERIHAVLREATQLRARGKWAAALDAAKTAGKLAAEYVDDRDLSERIERLGAQIVTARDEAKARAARVARDDHMVATLAEIGAWVARQNQFTPKGEDPEEVDRQYEAAFRNYGIDPDALAASTVVSTIRSRAIASELTSALDDWVWVRRVGCGMPSARWQPLLQIANRVDADPFRVSLRQAIHGRNGAKLRALAANAPLNTLPARTLAMMGRALIEANDPATATRVLRAARRLHPDHVGVNHFLAQALVAQVRATGPSAPEAPERLEEALRCRSAIVGLRPDADESWIQLANRLLVMNRIDEGRSACWRAVELAPTTSLNHIGVGAADGLEGKAGPAAERDYERETRRRKIAPKRSAFLLGLGLGELQRDRVEQAITHLEAALAAAPDAAVHRLVLTWLPGMYVRIGRVPEGRQSAHTALAEGVDAEAVVAIVARDQAFRQRDPQRALATLETYLGPRERGPLGRLRARLLALTGDWARRRELLEARIESGNEPPATWIELGTVRTRAGDPAAGHEAFEHALATAPTSARLLAAVAWAYVTLEPRSTRDAARALVLARQSVARDPNAWPGIASLAAATYAAGEQAEADLVIRRFLATRASGPLWADAGRVWANLHDEGRARAAYADAVRVFAGDRDTLNTVAWASVMSPPNEPRLTPEATVELARKAVALAPTWWPAQNTLALALFRAGDPLAALAASKAAVALQSPLHPIDGFVHAMAAWQLGAEHEARVWRERALDALIGQMTERDETDTLRVRDEALVLVTGDAEGDD